MTEGHIFIYGEIIPWQDDDVSSWGCVNLKNVVNQISDNKNADKLIIHIHSNGGDVNEGFAIHDALKNSGKEIETITEGLCASIATVIFLAGSIRKMTENSEFFIHNPWGMAIGDSEEMQSYTDDLKRLEDKIINFYAEKTGQTEESLREDMAKETTYSAVDAKEKGFATEVIKTIKAVAKYKPIKREMENKEVQEKLSFLDSIIAKFKGEKPKAIILQDADGTEIEFPDVEEGMEPKVGDKGVVDGQPASGEYVMPNGDVFMFEDGIIVSITPSEDEAEALKEKIIELESQLAEATASKELVENDLIQAKKDFEKKTVDFEKQLTEVKAMIKSDTKLDKKEKPVEGEPTKARAGYKTKKEE